MAMCLKQSGWIWIQSKPKVSRSRSLGKTMPEYYGFGMLMPRDDNLDAAFVEIGR